MHTCKNCGEKTVAEIKSLKLYNNHKVPVWYCEKCDLSTPTHRRDRHLWVDEYNWDPPGFVYGERMRKDLKCLGCNKSTMLAESEFLINEAFPFYEGAKPAWTCYRCGFSDKAMKEDGHLWADKFDGWRRG